ncbi:MAG: hypothetical protein KC416_02555 [Myxococcales bacterium]|nr:hypothetical protein [Myxococcales bacterium]
MRSRSAWFRALSISLGLSTVLVGCLQRDLKPLIPCTVSGVVEKIAVENVDKVDFLFVIDNSTSMAEEQAKLKDQLPRLVKTLATGDIDEDGNADFKPVKDLRIGVITTDMGVGGFSDKTGCSADDGDGGRLITRSAPDADDRPTVGDPPMICGPNGYGNNETFVSFVPANDAGKEDAFADKVSCVAVAGIGGCGFEQQLEAPLKALTPSSSDITFVGSTKGLGETNNFVRDDSLLVILMITDEEACSAADPEVSKWDSTTYPLPEADLNIRCSEFPQALYPVEVDGDVTKSRYVQGLLALREDNPGLLVFGAIVGIPEDLVPSSAERVKDVADTILEDSRMQYEIDRSGSIPALKPSCFAGSDGDAAPPRRIVQVAKGLDELNASVTLQSICQDSFKPALDAIIRKIADALGATCLPRTLNPNAEGLVECGVVETLPEGRTCAEFPGRELDRTEGGLEVCRVTQLKATGASSDSAPSEPGWYYEFDDVEGNEGTDSDTWTDLEVRCGHNSQRIKYVEEYKPITGATVRLECLQPAQEVEATATDVGGFCDPTKDTTATSPDGVGLICDGPKRSWQIPCNDDADCSPFVCDTVTRDPSTEQTICVNPTCGG